MNFLCGVENGTFAALIPVAFDSPSSKAMIMGQASESDAVNNEKFLKRFYFLICREKVKEGNKNKSWGLRRLSSPIK